MRRGPSLFLTAVPIGSLAFKTSLSFHSIRCHHSVGAISSSDAKHHQRGSCSSRAELLALSGSNLADEHVFQHVMYPFLNTLIAPH